jgi:hypothetical protein
MIDFIISLLIVAATVFSVWGAKEILYGKKNEPCRITIVTEPISKEITATVKLGDPIYDNLTKKQIGTVDFVSATDLGEFFIYRISLMSANKPRGNSLRTKTLWFRYTEE